MSAGSTALQTLSNLDAANGYQLRAVNLSTYAGQTISLSFTGIENSSAQTSFVLDDAAVLLSSLTAPDAPMAPTATAGNTEAVVSWMAPANDGGLAITAYAVTASPGGRTATTTGATSPTVAGLTNGTSYTFTVSATNAAGASAPSTASAAVTPNTISEAPTGVSATPGNAQAHVSWTAPAGDGGAPISGYTVTATPGGRTVTTTGTSTAPITGLSNGTAYTFTVTAANTAGTSLSSAASAAITPATTPGTPTGVLAIADNAEAVVSWTAPASDGGSAITGYTLTATPGGRTATTTGDTTATVTGLTNGTAYTFTVTATNTAGTSPASAASVAVTPRTVPGAPTGATAVPGNNSVVVSWTAPGSNGSAITKYTVAASPGGETLTTTGATAVTATGLTYGTAYTFTVTATNASGTSLPSSPSVAVKPTDGVIPDVLITSKPAALTASSSAIFSFSGTDGTDAASSLRYLCSRDGATASACTGPVTYTALTSAVHTFTVKVLDPSGNSRTAAYSWRVDRVVPTLIMTAPATGYSLTTSLAPAWSAKDVGGGLANVDVRWARAAWNGGFTAAVYPSTWQKTTATKATLSSVAPGYTYCFSARARDKAGNLSAWSAPRCSAVAMDDRSLAVSAGWSRVTSSVFYRSTATVTSRSAVTLTRTGVQAKRIYLVATRCPTCGTVGVYWNGTLIKKVSLYSSTLARRSVIGITTFTGVR